MAPIALLTESAAMYVITPVTADTDTGLPFGAAARSMTGVAHQPFMRTDQGKVGLLIVIESPVVPSHGVVAVVTGLTKGALVGVFARMTIHTAPVQCLELEGFVTLLTGCGPVHADQREPGEVVLKSRRIRPLGLFMATRTVGKRRAVRILNRMAALAVGGQGIGQTAFMAGGTHLLGMGADEFIAGFRLMVEPHLPGFLPMAVATVRAVTSQVCIVSRMAALTVGRQAAVVGFRGVTVAAAERAMRTFQRESGLLRVIELGFP